MKKAFTILIMLCLISFSIKAQTYISFNYSSPTAPTVFAGNDSTVSIGDTITLSPDLSGGTSPFTYNWSPGTAVLDSTVLNAQFILTSSAPVTLTLSVTDSNGCVVTDQITFTGPTNVRNLDQIFIEVYPNPSNGQLVLKGFPLHEKEMQVIFYNLSGKEVLNTRLHIENGTSHLDASILPSGVYLTRFQLSGQPFHQKIIIR